MEMKKQDNLFIPLFKRKKFQILATKSILFEPSYCTSHATEKDYIKHLVL